MSLVAFLIAACGAHRDAGPSWPKLHTADNDGGESLAPRTPAAVIEAEAEPDEQPTSAPAPSAKSSATAPAASTGTSTTSVVPVVPSPTTDDPMTTEEVIIEIDGD